jgi:hypothetical protein
MTEDPNLKFLKEKLKSSGIVISRLPKDTKDAFMKLAEERFCDDYGMTLVWLLDQATEYQTAKEVLFNNFAAISAAIVNITARLEQIEEINKTSVQSKRRTLSGEELKLSRREDGNKE